jgi:UDP-glucose 4-epimerase
MKILFTGASSFTGFWFVRALAGVGHEVIAPLRGTPSAYEGVRKMRADRLATSCRMLPSVPVGSEAFLDLLRSGGPWDLLCHHAAEATNYRSPDFDIHAATLSNTRNLRSVLREFKAAGGKAVVLTGTFFENDEGISEHSPRAFTGYGLAKGLTWQIFRFYCEEAQVPLGKFVIPNPFGPWEEPRFTTYLMRTWKQGKVASVKTPDYLRDNIHADLLTRVYLLFLEQMRAHAERPETPYRKINPSGYVESQGAFAERVAREMRPRTGWACGLELLKQEEFSEPLSRRNPQPAAAMAPDWNEQAAWDGFAEYYATSGVI